MECTLGRTCQCHRGPFLDHRRCGELDVIRDFPLGVLVEEKVVYLQVPNDAVVHRLACLLKGVHDLVGSGARPCVLSRHQGPRMLLSQILQKVDTTMYRLDIESDFVHSATDFQSPQTCSESVP